MIVDYTDGGVPTNPYRRGRNIITPAQERKDLREQRSSWRSTNKLYALVSKHIMSRNSEERRRSRIMSAIRSKADAARRRFQVHFLSRLERLIAETKERNSSPTSGSITSGLIGAGGVLAGLLAMKALTTSVNALRIVGGGLLSLLRKGASVGGGVIRRGARKFMSTRAGALVGMAYNSAKALLTPQGIALLSRRARGLLMSVLARALPSTLLRLVTGPVGLIASIGLAAKWVWDAILPDSWKKEIEYQVAKHYLKAIDGMTKVFEWVGNYWKTFKEKLDSWKQKLLDFKNGMSDELNQLIDTTGGFFSFLGSAISSSGSERDSIVAQWQAIVDTVSNWFDGITGWINDIVKPFYVDGKFNFSAGVKAYKSRYDDWRRELDDAIGGTIDMAIQNAADTLSSATNKAKEAASTIAPTKLAEKAQAVVDSRKESERYQVNFADEIDGKEKFTGYIERDANGMFTYNGRKYSEDTISQAIVKDLNDRRRAQIQPENFTNSPPAIKSTLSKLASWTNSTDPIKVFADFFSADRVAKAYQEAIEAAQVKVETKAESTPPNKPLSQSPAPNTSQPIASIISRPNLSETNPHINSYPRGLV